MRRPATRVDLRDIQGNILRGYGFRRARYLFARVRDPAAARVLLGDLAAEVTSAEPWTPGAEPGTTLNVALSHAGLAALGLGDRVLASFPDEVRGGMAARAAKLGDRDDSAPERWQTGLGPGEVEVLAILHGRDHCAEALADRASRLLARMEAGGLEPTLDQEAASLDGNREHFGFSDGFGQPSVAGDGRHSRPGQGTPERWRPWQWRPWPDPDRPRSATDRRLAWRALEPGEFVLGYDDEDGRPPRAPAAPFHRNATFMVWRKLAQDVAGFRARLALAAHELETTSERVAAKLVGRWPDGSPLVLAPDRPLPALGAAPAQANDFAYARHDPDGFRCPRGAHVRRVNPRDALGWEGRLTRRQRMMRRGMPYGAPMGAGGEDAERGLIFVALQASIERQFETVQEQWCNDGDAFGLGHEPDALVAATAQRPARFTIEGDPPRFVAPLHSYVTLRGGEYLVVPGRTALRSLPH